MRYPVNRPCPITGEPAARTIAHVRAAVVAAENQTYRDDYAALLGISPEDEFPIVEGPTGFVYAGWLPPPGFLSRVYEDVIDHSKTVTTSLPYRHMLLEFGAAFQRVVLEQGRPTPLRLLDFGCGYGALLRILASHDIQAVGYEPSTQRRQVNTADGDFTLLSDIDELERAGPFDLFVCTEVLEHVPEPREVLRLLRRLAAPGALLGLTVPQCDLQALTHSFSEMERHGRLSPVINPWEHLNYFSSASLRRLLADEGFEIIHDHGAGESFRQVANRVGTPQGFTHRLLGAGRLARRAVRMMPSTQVFCRVA